MKKILFLVVILMFTLGVSCKKKVETVEAPPPPPPPIVKVDQQNFLKGLISRVPQLEPGKVVQVQVDKSRVISDETEFSVSLFPLEFLSPAEKPYVVKYLFPSVVWRFTDSQLPVWDLPEYLDNAKPGEKFWILKDSPDPNKPFNQIPTLLVEASGGKFWVLDHKGDEMRKR